MKAIYQSFNRGSIPVSYPVNILDEDHYTEEPVTHLNTPRVLCLSLLAAATAAGIAQCLLLFAGAITQLVYNGEFSVEDFNAADHESGIWVIGIPVAGALIVALLNRYCSVNWVRLCKLLEPFSIAIYIGTGIPLG